MNINFENALNKAAIRTGWTPRKVFDAAVDFSLIEIAEYMISDENAQFDFVNVDLLFSVPKSDIKKYRSFVDVKNHLLKEMVVSKPFEDVIGGYYESRFLEPRNPSDQFSNPHRVKQLVAKMKSDDDERPEIIQFPDFDCRTAIQTMSFMKQVFNEYGKNKMLNRAVIISDTDMSLLRIGVLQIMSNCLQHDVRIGQFVAVNFDLLNGFEGAEKHVCWYLNAKTGATRKAALRKAKGSSFEIILSKAA